ncbi:MAG TPA: PKD domain-containing protein, partial [Flavobacteriales bacterium]|nr:PKD domain-containing protein [Flavobacteriales bacterium]
MDSPLLSSPLFRCGMRWIFALLMLCLAPVYAWGQAHAIFNGTESACSGAMLDSGGQGAGGYGNNENYTYTLCPDQPGGAISLNFITFNLSTAGVAPVDFMTIYDGNSTAAPVLGTWTGTSLQGQVVSASSSNPTGCLTVVFKSNNTGTGVFAASITCYQPCDRPTAVATHGSNGPLKICPGETVTFNGSGSYAAPGFNIANRRWDFGDGTILDNAPAVVSHTYTQPGAYTAQLYLQDNNGCASTNLVDLMTMVGTHPSFTGTSGGTACSAETLCLDGTVTPTTWNELPSGDLGGGLFLPDNVGQCFTTTITFTQFAPGQTFTNINQLLGICVNMEHSYMGDLIIRIKGPTGQTVVLHQQGGGGTYLGVPVDNDNTPNIQGTCWNYCWSPTATNGTWANNGNGGTLPSGTYQSVQSLAGLIGSPLNGTWTFEVCDMWGLDNGFICDWSIMFDPALYPGLLEFTPVYGAGCDSSYWAGPGIVSTSANCNQVCTSGLAPGNHSFTYTVIDDFGCTYDTTVTVTIVPDLQVSAGPDATTCGNPVQLNANLLGGGFTTNCDYVLWLYDSYGDGWNANGYVTVTINGVSTSWTLMNGSSGYANITVPDGATIILSYNKGIPFANEQSFTLLNSNGVAVYSGNNPANGVVWTGTANCPNAVTYSWSPATDLSNPAIANPVATPGSTTQYCVTASQAGHPACAVTDCMTITVDDPAVPGTTASYTVCASAGAFNLYDQLNGTPPLGGTWTDPNQGSSNGTFIPGTSVPGVYSYSVTGNSPCGTSTTIHTVTVNVVTASDAGSNGSLTLCSSGAPESLFDALGGTPDAGGTWSGPSTVNGCMIDPASMQPGTYTYTVPGVAPCPDQSATVDVVIHALPEPGTDGSLTLCNSGAPESLFDALGGTPDAGGTWSGPSTVNGGMIDPASMQAGTYTYTVAGVAPCPDQSANVDVVIHALPNPGIDGGLTLCSSSPATSLMVGFNGTPDGGGIWTGPNNTPSNGTFIPSTDAPGIYTYTVNGSAPCPTLSATVDVGVVTNPDAGTPGSATLCATDAPIL